MSIFPKFNIQRREFKELATSKGAKRIFYAGLSTVLAFLLITPLIEQPIINLVLLVIPSLNGTIIQPLVEAFISGSVGFAVGSIID